MAHFHVLRGDAVDMSFCSTGNGYKTVRLGGRLSLWFARVVTAAACTLSLGMTWARGEGLAGSLRARDIGDNMFASVLISESEVLMVGDRGRIYRASDGGDSWSEVASGTAAPLFSVSFPNRDDGWISGKSGLILHTADRGRNWTRQVSGTDKHFFSIDFSDAKHGCAVGDWGGIVVTEDGGATWTAANLAEDIILYAVCLQDGGRGYLAGEFGHLFGTEDGGHTWVPLVSGVEHSLFCMCADGDSVYAGGLDGVLLYSRDRGATWSRAQSDSESPIYGMAVSGQTGWAVGESGTVLQSTDGGAGWHTLEVPLKKKLVWIGSVTLLSGSSGGIVGFGTGAHGLYFTVKGSALTW
jgi:photosystem II stability/assembly factor-like uncharacterized protein